MYLGAYLAVKFKKSPVEPEESLYCIKCKRRYAPQHFEDIPLNCCQICGTDLVNKLFPRKAFPDLINYSQGLKPLYKMISTFDDYGGCNLHPLVEMTQTYQVHPLDKSKIPYYKRLPKHISTEEISRKIMQFEKLYSDWIDFYKNRKDVYYVKVRYGFA